MTPPWSAGEEAVVPVANCATVRASAEANVAQKKKATGDPDRVRFRLAATFIDQTSIKNDG
jgi:hypothetical protein